MDYILIETTANGITVIPGQYRDDGFGIILIRDDIFWDPTFDFDFLL